MKKAGKTIEVSQGEDTTTRSQTGVMNLERDIPLVLVELQALLLITGGSTPPDQGTKNPEEEERSPETEGTGEIETDIIPGNRRSSSQMRALVEISEEGVQGEFMGQKGQSPMAIGRLPEVTARRFHAWGNLQQATL